MPALVLGTLWTQLSHASAVTGLRPTLCSRGKRIQVSEHFIPTQKISSHELQWVTKYVYIHTISHAESVASRTHRQLCCVILAPLLTPFSADIFNTPSPGAYYPEKVHPQGEKHSPTYSMGARTRYRKRDATPSPNSYTLPSLLGSRVPNKQASSAYSMAGRPITGSFSEDLAKSPGPGRYDTSEIVSNSPKAPAYSMLSRRTKSGGVCVCVCVCVRVCVYSWNACTLLREMSCMLYIGDYPLQ